MKRIMWLVVLFAGLGVWAGVQASPSPLLAKKVEAGVAILLSGNLLFMTWIWSRSRRGSSDALFMPDMMLVLVAMLIGLVPRLFWRGNDTITIAAALASGALIVISLVAILRRNRRLRAARLGE